MKGPIAEFNQATYYAREVMADVGRAIALQTGNAIIIVVLPGVILGAFGSYFFYNQEIGRISERLDIQQQIIAPVVRVPETKPPPSNSLEGRHHP